MKSELPRFVKVALLAAGFLLIWSALFAPTFRYAFHWDDIHSIRSYSTAEILSTFHGLVDPDQIETPGLRPISTLLYDFQGTLFGENVVLQKIFVLVLMEILLIAVGCLLLELGLGLFQIALIFALFIFSRVFASLALWICLSHILSSYVWVVLTALFFVLWIKRRRTAFLVLLFLSATVAVFNREEAYTLPLSLLLIWAIWTTDHRNWRPVAFVAAGLSLIMCFHYALWHLLVPQALSPHAGFVAAKRLVTAMAASWLPGGYNMIGPNDKVIGLIWVGFVLLVAVFLFSARPRARWQFVGICCLGALLSLPAIAVARSFGIALPTIAFLTAIVFALREIQRQLAMKPVGKWRRYAFYIVTMIGFVAGIGGGIHRSMFVAESLRENCAVRAARDGEFLFNQFDHPVTIPPQRRQAGLARLARFGIYSAEDLKHLQKDLHDNPGPYEQRRQGHQDLFLPKYEYLSF